MLARLLLAATVFLPLVGFLGLISIWVERKVSARIQSRVGPDRVGKFGLLQSLADGIKLILKEDLIPTDADNLLFRLAPYLAFVPVFIAFLALPLGPTWTFEPRLSAGVFWLSAVLSVEVIGVILAGWAGNSKWSMYGGMREACQMVCYEIPLGLSVVIAVMSAGTLNLVALGHLQAAGLHSWLIFRNPFVAAAFVVYFVAGLASSKRAPFDLPESESELVAGYHIEYSGLRFSLFYLAEYAGMWVVAAVQSALFLGGWNDPFGWVGRHAPTIPINLIAASVFATKCTLLVLMQMWVRWTFPRPRIDQVLYICVKVLFPMSAAVLVGSALWQLFVPEDSLGGIVTRLTLATLGTAMTVLVLGWVAFAFFTGRRDRQRLTPFVPH